MRKIFALLIAALALQANASCILGQTSSVDKDEHLLGTMAITLATNKVFDDPDFAMATAIAIAYGREGFKATTPGFRCEWMSMAYDAAGIFLGTKISQHWIITPRKQGVHVTFIKQF